MDWIINNWDNVLAAIGAASVLAAALAKVTPNKTDDAIVAKVQKVLDVLALNVSK